MSVGIKTIKIVFHCTVKHVMIKELLCLETQSKFNKSPFRYGKHKCKIVQGWVEVEVEVEDGLYVLVFMFDLF